MRAPARICPCGLRTPYGALCPCQQRRAAERKQRFDRKRPNANARGYDAEWRKARAEYLVLNRTCRKCPAPATIIDHILPHKGNQKLFWNRANWQPLCKPCHDRTKQAEEHRNDRE